MEAGVERAVWIDSPDVIAHDCAAAPEGGEKSTDYNLAVALHRQRIDNVVRTGIEVCVKRAVRV